MLNVHNMHTRTHSHRVFRCISIHRPVDIKIAQFLRPPHYMSLFRADFEHIVGTDKSAAFGPPLALQVCPFFLWLFPCFFLVLWFVGRFTKPDLFCTVWIRGLRKSIDRALELRWLRLLRSLGFPGAGGIFAADLLPLQRTGPETHLAVAQKTGIPKWVALVSGKMGQHLRFAPPV